MQYHVARDGQQLGEFPDQQLREGLFNGSFLTTDMAWREGMGEWVPLGQLFGAPRAAVPRRPVVSYDTSVAVGNPPSSGMAITSLVMGIISILTCGLLGVGTITAIVTGHLSLSRINRSGGTVGGRGMAVTGLILGYVSIVTTLLAVFIAIPASLAVPTFARIQERAEITKVLSNARQLATHCRVYAADNDGNYPDNLDALVTEGVLTREELDELNSLKPSMWKGEVGFEYLGKGKSDSEAVQAPLFASKAGDSRKRRIIAWTDGSAALGDLPAGSQ